MRQKPISKAEISERALWIACEMFEMLETELQQGEGPATARQIRRFFRGKARQELLKERHAKTDAKPSVSGFASERKKTRQELLRERKEKGSRTQ